MIRFCQDIGLWALDRPVSSCLHRTRFCAAHCYNRKLYRLYPAMKTRDQKNETYWQGLTGQALGQDLKRKRKGPNGRLRLCTRGEPFSTEQDVLKVLEILRANRRVLLWIPTRAWRNKALRNMIEQHVLPEKNARVLASIDPSNTQQEIEGLRASGWSTMFFGDNTERTGSYRCPKTWQGRKGACSTCQAGCFSASRVDVHLKTH